MQSLTDLNSRSRTIIEVTDQRPSGVRLDRLPSAVVDQVITASTSITVSNAVEILEVINYATANVRYRLTINAAFTPTSLSWATIPAGLTLTTVGNVYTISGIKTPAEWNIIKNPTWSVPAGYASYPIWYVSAELIYYDSELGQDVTIEWDIYDDEYFYIADLTSTAALGCTITRYPGIVKNLSVTATLTAITVDVPMNAQATLNCSITKFKGTSINLTASSSLLVAVVTDFFTLNYTVVGGQAIQMSLTGVTSPVTITWGDGTQNIYTVSGTASHTYTSPGVKKVILIGSFSGWQDTSASRSALTAVKNFASTGLTTLTRAFQGCTGLAELPAVLPPTVTDLSFCFYLSTMNLPIAWDTQYVTNFNYMFWKNSVFNQNISSWNTSRATSMQGMFAEANAFNQPIGSWNTSLVTDMSYMFYKNTAFNQAIGTWNTQSVTTMTYMFSENTAFNQNISAWNTQNVTNMSWMFGRPSGPTVTVFNQPINTWNVSNVTNFTSMFAGSNFNQSLSNWNTINARQLDYMFVDTSFNQPLTNWNTSNAVSMVRMFSNSPFNQSLANFNTQNVTTMAYMFAGNSSFNQPLQHFNTANVTTMQGMFQGASAFNQPLTRSGNQWNTSKVSNMGQMFQNASSFDQNLLGWCVPLIASKPSNFDTGTSVNWTLAEKPVWGTCP